jgi:hypothetical protein
MANYIYWNQLLIFYFTSAASHGKRVYLSVDDEVLEQIGHNFSQKIEDGNWADDFRKAVRAEVVAAGRINLGKLQGCNADHLPR